ncbi:class I SAM-dependent methyltransferase [Actinosynnema sp. NPDC023794]
MPRHACAGCGGLRLLQVHRFGAGYARTLATWRETFLANVGDVYELGYDDTFCRMWEFYLPYCEAGFRSGDLDGVQVAFERVLTQAPRTASGEQRVGGVAGLRLTTGNALRLLDRLRGASSTSRSAVEPDAGCGHRVPGG